MQRFLSNLAATREKVLDRPRLAEGERLLGVGGGEGLIAFGALAPRLHEALGW